MKIIFRLPQSVDLQDIAQLRIALGIRQKTVAHSVHLPLLNYIIFIQNFAAIYKMKVEI